MSPSGWWIITSLFGRALSFPLVPAASRNAPDTRSRHPPRRYESSGLNHCMSSSISQSCRNRSSWGIYVQGNILVRIIRRQKQQLGNDRVGNRIVNRTPATKMMRSFNRREYKSYAAFPSIGSLHNHGDQVHGFFLPSKHMFKNKARVLTCLVFPSYSHYAAFLLLDTSRSIVFRIFTSFRI